MALCGGAAHSLLVQCQLMLIVHKMDAFSKITMSRACARHHAREELSSASSCRKRRHCTNDIMYEIDESRLAMARKTISRRKKSRRACGLHSQLRRMKLEPKAEARDAANATSMTVRSGCRCCCVAMTRAPAYAAFLFPPSLSLYA